MIVGFVKSAVAALVAGALVTVITPRTATFSELFYVFLMMLLGGIVAAWFSFDLKEHGRMGFAAFTASIGFVGPVAAVLGFMMVNALMVS